MRIIRVKTCNQCNALPSKTSGEDRDGASQYLLYEIKRMIESNDLKLLCEVGAPFQIARVAGSVLKENNAYLFECKQCKKVFLLHITRDTLTFQGFANKDLNQDVMFDIFSCLDVPESWFCFDGFQEGAHCVEKNRNKWIVYFGIHGVKTKIIEYNAEYKAYEDLQQIIIKRLNKLNQ